MITFEELGISRDNFRALTELGFEYPTPIQEKVIPLLLTQNTDIVALAQTGTGKTAAFGVPLIQITNTEIKQPQVLILSPTRELCMQIAADIKDFSKFRENIKTLPVYGGSSIENQISALKKGIHIIVATPGRLLDLINRQAVKLNMINTVVLDEADEMLNMGFQESINDILAKIPSDHKTLLFSATMPREVAQIAKNYMRNPVEITAGNKNTGAENIKHFYYTVHARDKYLALKRLVDFYPDLYGIVFCRTRKETQEVADKLINDGYNAEALHGDLSQSQRDYVMQKFRIRHLKLLVATDVAARGIDVDDLTHIINYNLPDDLDAYIHRSGRTARAGKTGTSIALINLREKHLIKTIEKKINKPFIQGKVPGGREICEKQLFSLIDKMEKVETDDKEIDLFLPAIYRKLEWIEKEEIIKRFVALEFNRFLEYYKNAADINVYDDRKTLKENEKSSAKNSGVEKFIRLTTNIGKAEGFYPRELLELIKQYSPGKRINIGRIELQNHSTIFETDSYYAQPLLKALKKATFNGIPVIVDFYNVASSSKHKRNNKNENGNKRKNNKRKYYN